MSALRDAHVSFFRENGFVVVPDLLTREELERHGAAVDAAVRSRMSADARALHEKSRYEQSFQQCINLWEDFEDVRPLSFHPRVASAAAQLLGVHAGIDGQLREYGGVGVAVAGYHFLGTHYHFG